MFKNLAKAVLGVATLPIDVVADVVTLGGQVAGDKGESYTADKVSKIMDNIDRAVDPDEDEAAG